MHVPGNPTDVYSLVLKFFDSENKNIAKYRLAKSNNVRWEEYIWARYNFMWLVFLENLGNIPWLVFLENLGNIPKFRIKIKTPFILEIWSAKYPIWWSNDATAYFFCNFETASFSVIFDELWRLNNHWNLCFPLLILQNSFNSYNINESNSKVMKITEKWVKPKNLVRSPIFFLKIY